MDISAIKAKMKRQAAYIERIGAGDVEYAGMTCLSLIQSILQHIDIPNCKIHISAWMSFCNEAVEKAKQHRIM